MFCRLKAANIDVTLSRTFETDVPGLEFGVMGTAADLEGSKLNVTIPINLVSIQGDQAETEDEDERNDIGIEPLKGETVDSCTVTSGRVAFKLLLFVFERSFQIMFNCCSKKVKQMVAVHNYFSRD